MPTTTSTRTSRPLAEYELATIATATRDARGGRIDHASTSCPAAKADGETVTVDPTEPGWPCSTCFTHTPDFRTAFGNEDDEPWERPEGDGTGSRTRTVDAATGKQLGFIAKLRSERGVEAPEGEQLTKREASKLIDELLAMTIGECAEVNSTKAEAPAHRPNRYAAACAECGQQVPEQEGALTKEAGKWITRHVGDCPESPRQAAAGRYEPEEGDFHRIDGALRRVRRTRNGHLIGQQVHVHSEAEWDGTTLVRAADVEWEYLGKRGLTGMTADTKLTAEEAAEFGHATGRCVFCTTALEDERSVNAGYGPVCADKQGLPWGG